ncbi:hypothetical protein F503_00954 [Ophiostoma piceae UAMH 11346]|uniref:Uncharacterized protein n=1 Tax=Ophiostoma piceae (strain UAMH 11346) TaxID=1262450 RepID=S3C8A9_OPHP1|nr:hypothetical protein F503_00954 [Ophiostoma piceae UAMH 11346]
MDDRSTSGWHSAVADGRECICMLMDELVALDIAVILLQYAAYTTEHAKLTPATICNTIVLCHGAVEPARDDGRLGGLRRKGKKEMTWAQVELLKRWNNSRQIEYEEAGYR